MELTRKDLLKLGVLGSAVAAFPVMTRTAKTGVSIKDRLPESKLPKQFQVPLSVPRRAVPVRTDATTDFYQLTMKARRVQILPDGPKTYIFGYDGITPGPTVDERRARRTVVRQINNLPAKHPYLGYDCTTSVHLHGNASKPQYDGYASDVTEPGEGKDYHYPNNQDARTLWYHDHGAMETSLNAYMGCAAFYISHDAHEMSLPIPHGRYDVPVVLRDAVFSRKGELIFDDQDHSTIMGDVILVNGSPWPVMKVERRKYRFRFLNAAISRSFNLSLSTGEPMTVIGHDGGLAPYPARVGSFRLGMAERYEVVIDFAQYQPGQQIVLRNRALRNNEEFANTDVVMRFDVVDGITDPTNNAIPEILNPNPAVMGLQESQAMNRRNPVRLELERQNGMWTINGTTWHDVEHSDFKKILANPQPGEIQVWELHNNSKGWFHPLHIHLVDFKILSRNGKRPRPYEYGPKDVAYLGEGETIRVIAKFGPHEGKYMVHCHNLVHEDHDMMGQFAVGSGGDAWNSDEARPVSEMVPFDQVVFKG